jgi:tetratricopeptide (TPR) repeat protein
LKVLAHAVALFLLSLACLTFAQGPDPQKLFQEASDALKRGDTELAVRDYQELLRLHPDFIAARANLGLALVSLGRLDEAIAQYQAGLAQVPDDPGLRAKLAMAYYVKGDLPEAADGFSSVLKDKPGNMEIATRLANCYVRLGHADQALSVLSPLGEAHPDDVSLQLTLGWALVSAGRGKEGLERIDRAAHRARSAEAYKGAAAADLSVEAFENARRNVAEAIRLNPHLPGVYTLSGMIATRLGDYDGAAVAFEKELEANPDDFQAQLHFGEVLYTQRGLDAARAHLERALEIVPDSPVALYDLGRVKSAQGQPEAAVKDLERVVRARPDWIKPHVELSALYYRLKRPEDSEREKRIVDRLADEERQRLSQAHTLSTRTPAH